MATIFGGSRLANLRQKRTSGDEGHYNKDEPLKLGLHIDESDKISYEPTTSNINNRTHTRLLKGRIDRTSHDVDQNKFKCQNGFDRTSESFKPKLGISPGQTQQLRLVINDDLPKLQQKKSVAQQNPMRTTQKRILIAKQPERQKVSPPHIEQPKVQSAVIVPDVEPEKPIVLSHDTQRPIREQDIQQSMQQANQNDLVQCPEGCGRKFNRKALQKHAKACKLVFMSKRKQFNSEAKRLVNKEQANIAKQVKANQKKGGKTNNFGKTGDNWKAASQDFRAAIKAIKKDVQDEPEKEQNEQIQEQMKILPCKFCEKAFAQVFLQKHMQNCTMKKKDEKKKTLKKK